jgi:superoxide dismutase, Cu-Zn family
MKKNSIAFIAWATVMANASADIIVGVNNIDAAGSQNNIGYIALKDVPGGLEISPNLHSLSEGEHGFHIHQNGSCSPMIKDGVWVPGLSAGGHFDPEHTGKHSGPSGNGHFGDMPFLYVNAQGIANKSVIAPRLTESMVKGKSIIIHEGGDNFADTPAPLGGGGARLACGLI